MNGWRWQGAGTEDYISSQFYRFKSQSYSMSDGSRAKGFSLRKQQKEVSSSKAQTLHSGKTGKDNRRTKGLVFIRP